MDLVVTVVTVGIALMLRHFHLRKGQGRGGDTSAFESRHSCYPTGTFSHHPAGSAHLPQSQEGCVLVVFFPED